MKFRDLDIELLFTINSIQHIPVKEFAFFDVFGNSPNPEYKKIELTLHVTIEKVRWEIPYLLLLEKSLKYQFVEKYNVSMNDNDEYFYYLQQRHINIPLFSLRDDKYLSELIDLLLLLDLNQRIPISALEFINLDSNRLVSENDKEALNNSGSMKYCIKKYHGISKNPNSFFSNYEMWKVPHINLVSKKSESERVINIIKYETNEIISSDSYVVVPVGYSCSFCPSIDDLLVFKFETPIKTSDIYFENFAECKICLRDNTKFKALLKTVYKAEADSQRIKDQGESEGYYNRGGWKQDYFDAVTGGQMGDYKDFQGDIDNLDIYSRG